MQFLVYRATRPPLPRGLSYPYVSLFQDNWDDFGWRCRFIATLHRSDDEDDDVDLGAIRIATDGDAFRVPQRDLPAVLEKLPARSASLGESIAYYRRIGDMPLRLRNA